MPLPVAALHSNSQSWSIRSQRADNTLLLVDDDAVLLAVLKTILTREGYQVVASSSPLSAIEWAAKNTFSMLITDFQMPDVTGFALACTLAEHRPALPVLVLSGSDPADLPTVEIARHHWNFMAKPMDRKHLLRIVDGECLGWIFRTVA